MICTETFSLLLRIFFSSTSASVAEAREAFNAFREIVHENRLQPSSGPYGLTYGKQRIVRNFEVGESVNVADLHLIEHLQMLNGFFGQAKQVHNGL